MGIILSPIGIGLTNPGAPEYFRLWSFQGRDTKLERFLAKNQLYSNEIIKFAHVIWVVEVSREGYKIRKVFGQKSTVVK